MTRIATPKDEAGVAAANGAPRAGARPSSRKVRLRLAKLATVGLALVPIARILVELAQQHLGPNPIAEVMNRLGWWTLSFLLLSLAMTPLARLTETTWPIALRKTLGLTAFTYAALHLLVYLCLDQFFDFAEIGKDIVKRKFITVGFLAFVLLIPLAVTSTAAMVKRLGARRWRRLHRLVYVAAPLGVVHFIWRVKADLREPLVFAAILAALLGVRIVWRRPARAGATNTRGRVPAATGTPPPPSP